MLYTHIIIIVGIFSKLNINNSKNYRFDVIEMTTHLFQSYHIQLFNLAKIINYNWQ